MVKQSSKIPGTGHNQYPVWVLNLAGYPHNILSGLRKDTRGLASVRQMTGCLVNAR